MLRQRSRKFPFIHSWSQVLRFLSLFLITTRLITGTCKMHICLECSRVPLASLGTRRLKLSASSGQVGAPNLTTGSGLTHDSELALWKNTGRSQELMPAIIILKSQCLQEPVSPGAVPAILSSPRHTIHERGERIPSGAGHPRYGDHPSQTFSAQIIQDIVLESFLQGPCLAAKPQRQPAPHRTSQHFISV